MFLDLLIDPATLSCKCICKDPDFLFVSVAVPVTLYQALTSSFTALFLGNKQLCKKEFINSKSRAGCWLANSHKSWLGWVGSQLLQSTQNLFDHRTTSQEGDGWPLELPGAAELPCACSPFGFYAFSSWHSPSQTLKLLMVPSSAVLPLSVFSTLPFSSLCHSSAGHSSEQAGVGQCYEDKPEQGESPQRTLQGSAHSGIREREGYKSVSKRMSVLQMKGRCPVERCQHRAIAATVVQCRRFAFVAPWAMPAWFCFIIWQIKVPKGWHLPVCAPPCLAVRQCSITVLHMSSCVFVRRWQWRWRASLVLAAASLTLLCTLQAWEHFAWGCEEPSLQGITAFQEMRKYL